MKKIFVIAIIIFSVIIAGIFYIGFKMDSENDKEQTTIGVVLNGKKDDRSWSQALYDGMEKTAKELNLSVIYKEDVPESEESIKIIEELIDDGSKMIICNSFGYGDYVIEEAEKHPDIYFYHATGLNESENVATYFGRIYQMRYLSGIVAGLQTKTNEIGYLAAFPITEVNRGLNAFTLGVRSVNKNAKVYAKFCYSWIDDEQTKTASNELFNNYNIDVVGMHVDSLKVLETADERGIWSIGYNYDNSSLFPDTYLTAPIWKWENFYIPKIRECLKGRFEGRHYWEGTDTGIVDLAPLTSNVSNEISEVVEAEYKKIESGKFDVFYGPVKDNNGNIRIAQGESMSDYAMLNEFDWYVEGVEICD